MANCPTRETLTARGFAIVAALGLIGSISADARATVIKYDFGGVITSAAPSTGIEAGTRFSGTFAYDPAETAAGIQFEGHHEYAFGKSDAWPTSPPDASGLTLDVGGRPIYSGHGGLALMMTGDEPSIGYPRGTGTHVAIANGWVDSLDPLRLSIDLSNPDRAVYPTLAPPSSLKLTDFLSATLDVGQGGGPGAQASPLYRGTIDTLKPATLPSPAPEPSTLALFAALGTGFLGRAACSRRSSDRRAG